MVGNSLRSDILPVLEIGGWAVHIPARLSWAHEDAETCPRAPQGRFFELDQPAGSAGARSDAQLEGAGESGSGGGAQPAAARPRRPFRT